MLSVCVATPAAGSIRTKDQVGKRFRRDLELVGIPHRRFHDARRTFISLAQADGAQREHLLPVTHTSGSTRAAFDLYTTIPWSTRAAAVTCFRPVPPSNHEELARWILAEKGCYAGCYVANEVPEITGEKVMEAPGVEPVSHLAENLNDQATLARKQVRTQGNQRTGPALR